MSRRHISNAEIEIGIHERDRLIEAANLLEGHRPKRQPLKPEFDPERRPAPASWSLWVNLTRGYLYCRDCKCPTDYAPETTDVCVKCGGHRLEFVPPAPAFKEKP